MPQMTKNKSHNKSIQQLRSQQSSQNRDYDTFNGDSAGCAEPTLLDMQDMQDLKSPRREILH